MPAEQLLWAAHPRFDARQSGVIAIAVWGRVTSFEEPTGVLQTTDSLISQKVNSLLLGSPAWHTHTHSLSVGLKFTSLGFLIEFHLTVFLPSTFYVCEGGREGRKGIEKRVEGTWFRVNMATSPVPTVHAKFSLQN